MILQFRNWSCRLLWWYNWFSWKKNVTLNNEFWSCGRCFRAAGGPVAVEQCYFFLNMPSIDGVWLPAWLSFLSYLDKLPLLNCAIHWLMAVILIHISWTEQTGISKHRMVWLHLKSKSYLRLYQVCWWICDEENVFISQQFITNVLTSELVTMWL